MKFSTAVVLLASASTALAGVISERDDTTAQDSFNMEAYNKCVKYAPSYNDRVPNPGSHGNYHSQTEGAACKKKLQEFSAANGTLQCKGTGKTIRGGKQLADAIDTACSQIINSDTGSLWLNPGTTYAATINVGGTPAQFALQILKGGFSVSHDFCTGKLAMVMGCATGSKNIGGCSFTTDQNLQSCILI